MYTWFTRHPKLAFFGALALAFFYCSYVYASHGTMRILNVLLAFYWTYVAVIWFYKDPPKPPLTRPTPPSKSSTIKDDSNI